MQFALIFAPALISGVLAAPSGVSDKVTIPAGCAGSLNGKFEITVAKTDDEKRSVPEEIGACDSTGAVVITLRDGKIVDAKGRIGYIGSDYQFQFDKLAQSGALITGGFSVCEGNTLALGSSKTFFQCRSGDIYNLYDRTWAAHCKPASVIAVRCSSESTASQTADSQVVETTVAETASVTALAYGQPQVVATTWSTPVYSTCISDSVSDYTDGQVQGTFISTAPQSTMTAWEATYLTMSTTWDTTSEFTSMTSWATTSESQSKDVLTGTPSPSSTTSWETMSKSTSKAVLTANPLPSSETAVDVTAAPNNASATVLSSDAPMEIATSIAVDSSSGSSALFSTATSTSAPHTGGSSHVAGGSMSALVIGMLATFFRL
ncbi:hypothetical protein GGS21DRAFT_491152 [Xylaria nigripes]|nr:hypothetical protein GGS21DRAFT_491152 [Xylaria nigripes]